MQNQKKKNTGNFTEPEKLNLIEDYLERTMSKLPPENTTKERNNYLAGIIDCLCDVGMVNELQREDLYISYVG